MECEHKWTVYLHISPSQKFYVGITGRDPQERWGNNGYGYHNQPFFRAIEKYGWDNFHHIIIASDLTETEAKEMEKDLIALLASNHSENGYNITIGGDGIVGIPRFGKKNSFYGKQHTEDAKRRMSLAHQKMVGSRNPFYNKHHSDATKAKISAARKGQMCGESNPNYGKHLSPERIEQMRVLKSRPICQFDTDMNFICEYSSTKEAELATGIDHSLICRVCRGKLKTIHGSRWLYKEDAVKMGTAV